MVKESVVAEQYVSNLLMKQSGVLESIKINSSSLVIKALEQEYEALETQIKEVRTNRGKTENDEQNIKRSIKYTVYLMEHCEELLIDRNNSLQQRQVFALPFEELPTYDELVNGTPKLSPIFALNANQNLRNLLWCTREESNLQPAVPKTDALSIKLRVLRM